MKEQARPSLIRPYSALSISMISLPRHLARNASLSQYSLLFDESGTHKDKR